MRFYLKSYLIVAIFLLLQLPMLAQVSGSITGTVRDSSDAVVPNAKVSVFNNDRGVHRDVVSNATGDYLVQGLGEGTYSVKVAARGYQGYLAENTVLRVGQNIRVDARLSVGSQTTEVTVEGSSAGTIETQSSELSTTITAKQISQLELNGRSFVQLIELSPGVSNQTGQSSGTTGPGGSVSYSVNGGRTEYNNWEIDGGDVMDSGSMSNLNVFPNVDALDQVQVFTSSYDAQYGRSGSGAIEAVTKSGTNEFHGEAFEFLRNQLFNAKNYFNLPGERIGAYKKHDFGGTVGGPIIKDKLFFFYSEELRRENVPGFYNTAIPTNAERAGNFNAVCPAAGTIFYRSTTVYPDCPAYQDDAAQDGGFIGFPNNNVSNYIDPNAKIFLNYIPQQNAVVNGQPYFQEPASAPYTSHEELFKIDYNISSKLHASFRFIHDATKLVYATSVPSFPAYSNLPGIPGQELGPGVSIVANLQWTASPTLTNEFMIGYGANHLSITTTTNAAKTPAGLSMTSLFPNGFGGKVPSFNISGGATFGSLIQDAGATPFYNSNPTYTYRDTVTKLLHAHNLKTGFYFTANQKNEDAVGNTQGNLGFNGNISSSYTSSLDTDGQSPSTGNSFADFLVGQINTYQQSNVQPKYHFQFKIFEPFVQDDWHVSKKLTLNLGLRVSGFGLYTEKNNLAYNFDPTAYDPSKMPTVDPDSGFLVFAPGQSVNNLSGIVQCGVGKTPKGCMTGHILNPAPRIGFAYDPFGDGKTAIRGAYGIFFEHTNGNEANAESLEGQPPLVQTPIQFHIPSYESIGGGQFFPLIVNSIPTKVKWPYVQQFHLDVQREFARNTIATFSYVGSTGTHLTLQRDLNQITDLPAGLNPFPKGEPITPQICSESNPTTAGGTPIVGQALTHLNIACGNVNTVDSYRTQFPGWDTIDGIGYDAKSSYNALQVSARRTANNLELTLAYTYSHAIDDQSDRYDSSFVDSYNVKANRGNSSLDQRQILNFSYIYTLPTLASQNFITRTLLGGWEWSGITEIQTGSPFSIVSGQYYDNAGVANGEGTGAYMDIAPGISKTHITGPRTQHTIYGPLLFNPAAYNAPTGLTFGNSGRNSIYGPHTTNFDMGVFKHFPIHEKITAEFRAEAFNVFNHTQFESLNSGIGNSPSCYGPNAGFQYNAGNTTCVQGDASQGVLPSSFLHPGSVHDPRLVQFALKVLF